MVFIENFKNRIHAFLNRKVAVILTYHSVVDCPLGFDLWTHIPLERFEQHMALLAREANVISLKELVAGLQRGNLPEYSVVITFDDGFGNNYFRAFPVLKKYNLPASIFLSTGFIGTDNLFWPERLAYALMKTASDHLDLSGRIFPLSNMIERRNAYIALRDKLKRLHPADLDQELSRLESTFGVPIDLEDPLFKEWRPLMWNQVQEMSNSGLVDFGGHTVDHHILSRLTEAEAKDQIVRCRRTLDKYLTPPVSLWAYPNGTTDDFDEAHAAFIAKQGFSTALTTNQEYIDTDSLPHRLGRWGIGSTAREKELRVILAKRSQFRRRMEAPKQLVLLRKG